MTNQVQVSLGVAADLGITGVFLSTAPLITATATATSVPDGGFLRRRPGKRDNAGDQRRR